jgi:putative membrane protein
MYGHGGGLFSNGMFFGGGPLMWLFWIILLVVLAYVLKNLFTSEKRNSSSSDEALDILKQRFARGEIDEAEFERRKKLLR